MRWFNETKRGGRDNKKDGWYFVRSNGSHKHYKHPVKKGIVTIPFHPVPKDLNINCNSLSVFLTTILPLILLGSTA